MEIRPIETLIQYFFGIRRQVRPKSEGQIENHELASQIVDTGLEIIKAVNEGKQFFQYKNTNYSISQGIPSSLMHVTFIMNMESEERERFLQQRDIGEFDIRGVKFRYKEKEPTEQEKLEFELDKYITGGAFVDMFDSGGLQNIEDLVNKHSAGNPGQDSKFYSDLICTGQAKTRVTGRERLENLLGIFKIRREDIAEEMLPKYDRLIQIYSEQDSQKK